MKKIKKRKKEKGKNLSKRNIFLIALMSILIFSVSCIIVFIGFVIFTAPTFTPDALYPSEPTIILDKNGNEIAKLGAERREIVTYDELPQVLIDAIIATEDARFFQHRGFDLPRFTKAVLGQITGNSAAGGASTLTMQLSKNAYTDAKEVSGLSGLVRKFTDIYLAVFQIEKTYTKEEILEFYVNSPYLTTRSYGVEQTSWTLFGKSVKDLNLSEAALIAGLFQSPNAYNPYNNPEQAYKRRDTVLTLMVRHGYISEEEKKAAGSIPIESMLSGITEETLNPYQGFIDTVVEEVLRRTGNDPYLVPMIINTTMDINVQNAINDVMSGKTHKWVNDSIQGAIAITDVKDGSIAGIGNGRNKTQERALNLATSIKRHPGSSAKPFFDYAPYIEFNNGSTYSPFFDEPMNYANGTSLKNADNSYMGLMTMKEALARSRNIPAVQAFQYNDPSKVADFVHSMGIDYGEYLYESAAIGGFDGMSPLEMSAAYATFGRGGYYIEPYSYTKITYRFSGEVIEHKPKREQVMSEQTAFMMNYILMYGTQIGMGGNYRVSGTDIAVKGGTSTYDEAALKKYKLPVSAAMDIWLTTYSPDYSISLWYGYERLKEGQYVTSTAGSTARRQIVPTIANIILPKESKFDIPSGVVRVEIETGTIPAMLASAHTPSSLISSEYFRVGTEPTEVSSRFSTLTNPTGASALVNVYEVILSWDAIRTPEAINLSNLQEYFSTNYKSKYNDYSVKYYNQRVSYNSNNIGNNGYQIYLKNNDGSLRDLGFTLNNSFIYNVPSNGEYTFVIKSAYSIFKSNMSSGIEITVTV